jgi:hypothetical protein
MQSIAGMRSRNNRINFVVEALTGYKDTGED